MSIVLVDAYSQIFRCFYAIQSLTSADGQPVNALYGMTRLFLQLERAKASEYGAIVFDKGKASKRVCICPEYKAQRPPMPDALRSQVEPIRQWAEAFGWPIIEQEGLEADDLIAAITRQHGTHAVTIITSDKDISQLTADSLVTLALPDKGDAWKVTDALAVEKKFGVNPGELLDYLALVGDTADNIMGIPGVGPKTAVKLIRELGGVDYVLEHSEADAKLHDKLVANRELLERNRRLVALDNELPAGWKGLETITRRLPDWDRLLGMASALGFKSLVPALEKQKRVSSQPTLF